jgi:hypothetical protein
MENTASNNSHNSSSNTSIADPILNMYRESIDAWQKGYNGYNDFVQASRPQPGQTNAALNLAAAYENTSAQMQKTGEHIFRRAVEHIFRYAIEHQIELGRFLGKRQARYFDFWSDIAHCQSAADLVKVQSAFLTEMAADYGIESRRLTHGFQELLSSCTAAQPMSFISKQPAQY